MDNKDKKGRCRYKGQIVTAKVLAHRTKLSNLCQERKGKKRKLEDTAENVNPFCVGKRIVDLEVIGNSMICQNPDCNQYLNFRDVVSEKRRGIHSLWSIKCQNCSCIWPISNGKMHGHEDDRQLCDLNSEAVLGCIDAGIGSTALNKILACLNIPAMTDMTFKQYEREVGQAIEKVAKESCGRAAAEERALTIQNIESLKKELPEELYKELYNDVEVLLKVNSSEAHDKLKDSKVVDPVDEIIFNIIVSYDMGWTKRGNGRSYDSLNGYGAIIGKQSGKVLDFATRNRKCRRCDLGHDKADHDCRKNFTGSAKAMEPHVGAELVNRSKILKDKNLNVKIVIGDEDSSTIAAIRKDRSDTVIKLADSNHLKKHFTSELYALKTKYKEMRQVGVIQHLDKCFTYACAQNKGQSQELAKHLRMIPNHCFGNHENCGSWCTRGNSEEKQTILLKDENLLKDLQTIFDKYANNAHKFSISASSQANESLNQIMAQRAPKSQCYSLSESSDFRYASAVSCKNDGYKYILDVKRKLHVPTGNLCQSFYKKKDFQKKQKKEKSGLRSTKTHRHFLKKQRDILRKNCELNEGVQYKSNCGMEISHSNHLAPNAKVFDSSSEHGIECEVSSDTCDIVYFDVKTSGFGKQDDILQLAVKCQDQSFATYVNPTKKVSNAITEKFGLQNVNGELLLQNSVVPSVPIAEALHKLYVFCKSLGKFCLFVSYNARSAAFYVMKAINENSMMVEFREILVGFGDFLTEVKKKLSNRKGAGHFNMSALVKDFLPHNLEKTISNATCNVEYLEMLSNLLLELNVWYTNYKTVASFVIDCNNQKNASHILKTFDPLKSTISKIMINKIAKAGISLEKLQLVFSDDGAEGIYELLLKNIGTKQKKFANSIAAYFEQNHDS